MVQQWLAFECGCHILVNIVESALRPDLLCKSVVTILSLLYLINSSFCILFFLLCTCKEENAFWLNSIIETDFAYDTCAHCFHDAVICIRRPRDMCHYTQVKLILLGLDGEIDKKLAHVTTHFLDSFL